jgi:multidrug transporter EmrE-like cation transporter
MALSTLLLILVSVTFSALAQVSFKFGVAGAISSGLTARSTGPLLLRMLFTPGVFGGLALYGLATLLWLGVLRRIDVSQAYPFVGLGIALTSLLGYMLLGESLGPQKIIGTAFIITGIVVVAWS